MSTLTKVFVVLLVLFSVAFTTMTVAMVAQSANWRETALKYEERARIADTTLRNMIAATAAQETTARDTIQAHAARIGELEKRLQEINATASRLRSDLARVEADKGSADAMNRSLLAQVELSRDAESRLREQLNRVDRENIDLQQRNVDLNGRVNELHAQVAVMGEQRRQFEQQLNTLKVENDRLSQATQRRSTGRTMEDPTGLAMSNVKPLTTTAGSAIRGRILAVQDGYVTISVGTADGVQRDMKFVIHRNGTYIGDLQIVSVEPGQAGGRLTPTSTPPRSGDQVTDAVSLAGR